MGWRERMQGGSNDGKLVAGKIGIIVAGDMPEDKVGLLENMEVEPMEIIFRFHRDSRGEPFRIPCRPPNPIEAVLLINRQLQEGKVKFGFQQVSDGKLFTPGGM